jgi:hypothetical protein
MRVGLIIRDHQGQVRATKCSYQQYLTDPATAEAFAARQGADFCRNLGFQSVWMEGDAQASYRISNSIRSDGDCPESYRSLKVSL